MAPAAVIASYKALWTSANDEQSGGVVSDLVAAVDQPTLRVPVRHLDGAPQVAGLAGLYLSRSPLASPMAGKAALMTTATDSRTSSGAASTNAYAQGAGVVRPDRMLAPAVVVDSGLADWQAYLEAHGVPTGSGVAARDPVDDNAPSIAVGRLAGVQTVPRRLTATQAGRVTLQAAVPGFGVRVSRRPSPSEQPARPVGCGSRSPGPRPPCSGPPSGG